MKQKSTLILSIVLLLVTYSGFSQNAGDYRSRASGSWLTASTWERFDGSTWINPAPTAPASTDGVITIRTGDSVYANAAITIDQVVIDNGGILMLTAATGTTYTLNNGTGDDLSVSGRLYLSTSATLTGAGNVVINGTGEFFHQNSGVLSVASLVNNGTTSYQNTVYLTNTTFTNNELLRWITNNINLSNSSIINNDSIAIIADANINNTSGTNSVTNSSTGIIHKVGTGTNAVFTPFANAGKLKGNGIVLFQTVTANTGQLEPGSSPGILTVTNNILNTRATTLNIEISSTGAVAGTNYDQLAVSTTAGGASSIANATLNVTDLAADPANTSYTVLTNPGGILGTFANVSLPSGFTITYNATNVVVTKTTILPVTWGGFTAIAQGDKILLNWTTLNEENTSRFEIEYAKGNGNFVAVASVPAQTNASTESHYSYQFSSPDKTANNLFRIKQIDLNGKSAYSITRQVRFDKSALLPFVVYPNPVKDVTTINVQNQQALQFILSDLKGTILKQLSLQQGQHSLDMSAYPSGIYYLGVQKDGIRIGVQQIIKQ